MLTQKASEKPHWDCVWSWRQGMEEPELGPYGDTPAPTAKGCHQGDRLLGRKTKASPPPVG